MAANRDYSPVRPKDERRATFRGANIAFEGFQFRSGFPCAVNTHRSGQQSRARSTVSRRSRVGDPIEEKPKRRDQPGLFYAYRLFFYGGKGVYLSVFTEIDGITVSRERRHRDCATFISFALSVIINTRFR